jgi:hypothetical protein
MTQWSRQRGHVGSGSGTYLDNAAAESNVHYDIRGHRSLRGAPELVAIHCQTGSNAASSIVSVAAPIVEYEGYALWRCVVWVGGALVSTSTTTAHARTTTTTWTTKSSPQLRDCRPVFTVNDDKHEEILHFRDELDG